MPLFGKKQLPGPDAPLADHLAAIGAGRDGSVEAFVQALAARDLWLGAAELPEGRQPGDRWTSEADTTIPLLSNTLPDGTGRTLMVFSTQEGVQARAPQAFPLTTDGRGVLDLVLGSYDGVVVEDAGRWQALRSEWIARGLG